MPKFKVLRRVDAYCDYICSIEAASAEDASKLAYANVESMDWTRRGHVEFDAAKIVTLDEQGDEFDLTALGDL